jgi:RNA polymerase sigma-70 factor (ECF subfamily)
MTLVNPLSADERTYRYDSRAAPFTKEDDPDGPRSPAGGCGTMQAFLDERERPAAPLDERAQITLAQRDPHAFAPLYHCYADPVYRYCYRRLGDPEAAADATSTVFIRALAALPRYNHGSFRAWLFAIAHNTVIDGWRGARIEASLDATFGGADPAPSPEEQALRADADREIRALLAALPADQRHVVELRLAGLSNRDIAVTLGRTVGATKMLQVRALTRLRVLLQVDAPREDGQEP